MATSVFFATGMQVRCGGPFAVTEKVAVCPAVTALALRLSFAIEGTKRPLQRRSRGSFSFKFWH